MDTTETTEPVVPDYPLPNLVIGQDAKNYLYTAGKWARFLGILGFIATAIMALLCVFAGAVSPIMGALSSSPTGLPVSAGAGVLSIVPLLLIMILYFFVSYFLYQFGTNIKNGIAVNDMTFVTKAFRNLKSHFKLIGFTLIIIVICYIIAFIIGGLIVGSTFMHH